MNLPGHAWWGSIPGKPAVHRATPTYNPDNGLYYVDTNSSSGPHTDWFTDMAGKNKVGTSDIKALGTNHLEFTANILGGTDPLKYDLTLLGADANYSSGTVSGYYTDLLSGYNFQGNVGFTTDSNEATTLTGNITVTGPNAKVVFTNISNDSGNNLQATIDWNGLEGTLILHSDGSGGAGIGSGASQLTAIWDATAKGTLTTASGTHTTIDDFDTVSTGNG